MKSGHPPGSQVCFLRAQLLLGLFSASDNSGAFIKHKQTDREIIEIHLERKNWELASCFKDEVKWKLEIKNITDKISKFFGNGLFWLEVQSHCCRVSIQHLPLLMCIITCVCVYVFKYILHLLLSFQDFPSVLKPVTNLLPLQVLHNILQKDGLEQVFTQSKLLIVPHYLDAIFAVLSPI